SGNTHVSVFFFFQAEDGIRDATVTGVQTCALPISSSPRGAAARGEDAQGPVYAGGFSGSIAADEKARAAGIVDRHVAGRGGGARSEERRVGKEWRVRGAA